MRALVGALQGNLGVTSSVSRSRGVGAGSQACIALPRSVRRASMTRVLGAIEEKGFLASVTYKRRLCSRSPACLAIEPSKARWLRCLRARSFVLFLRNHERARFACRLDRWSSSSASSARRSRLGTRKDRRAQALLGFNADGAALPPGANRLATRTEAHHLARERMQGSIFGYWLVRRTPCCRSRSFAVAAPALLVFGSSEPDRAIAEASRSLCKQASVNGRLTPRSPWCA